MVSISKFQSAAQAAQYFQTDIDYYQQNDELGEWSGELAKELGLTGLIIKESYQDFTNLISAKENKRSGFDITCSAPKSVSILHAAANKEVQKLIEEAQREANFEAMQFAQQYITFRERTAKGRIHFKNNGLAIASFQHFTNREEEPQLHTHNFILNQTKNSKGKIVSIDNRGIYQNQILIGQIYHQKLFQELKKSLGLNSRISNLQKDIFEIEGISEEAINAFSLRRKEVEKRAQELMKDKEFLKKYPNANEKEIYQIAALDSRKAKKAHDYNELKEIEERHKQTLKEEFGLDQSTIKKLSQNSKEKETITKEELEEQACKLITENESTFSKEKLLSTAIKLNALHGFSSSLEQIKKSILNSQNIVKLDENIYTTKKILKIENEIKEKVIHSQAGHTPLASKEAIETHLKKFTHCTSKKLFDLALKGTKAIKLDQAKMIREILTSQASINIIQGDAGTGKTFAIKVMKDIIEGESPNRYDFIGLAPTAQAAQNMENDSGIKSSTIHSFLNQAFEDQNKEKIYIADEAGMIDSPLMYKLFNKIEENGGGKILLIGDKKQFQSIGAGGIFTHLQDKIKISELTDKTRQKTVILQDIVKSIEDKNIVKALDLLKKDDLVKESLDASLIAKEYDSSTLILASTNHLKNEINKQIRANLNLVGTEITTRQNEKINRYEKSNIHNYQTGQILFAQQQIVGMKAGEEGRIVEVDPENHQIKIELVSKEGEIKEVDIDIRQAGPQLQVFKEETRKIEVGEQIVFQKNDRMLGVANGTKGEVVALDKEGNIQIQTSKFKTVKINLKNYNYFDYAYAITDYKAQGATAKNVVVAADSRVATNNSFYVQMTRASESLKLYTDDVKSLTSNAAHAQLKTSTLSYPNENEELELKELKKLEKTALKILPITKIMQRKGGKIVENLKLAFNIAKLQNQYGYKRFKDKYHKDHIRKIQRKHAVSVILSNEKIMQLAGVKNIEDAKWLLNKHKIGFKKIEKIEEREVKIFGTIYLDSRAGWLNKIQKELNINKQEKQGAAQEQLKSAKEEAQQITNTMRRQK